MIKKNSVKNPRKEVTLKQRRFCQAYVRNGGNGVQAARKAGYKGSDNTLAAVASENLRKPNIKKFLAESVKRTEEKVETLDAPPIMCESEALLLTSILGRACITDLLDDKGRFDLQKAKESLSVYAIKKLTFYRSGKVRSVELRDKNGSVELMGRHHGSWTGEITDPDEVLRRFLKRPKGELPSADGKTPQLGQTVDAHEHQRALVLTKAVKS